MGKGSGKRCREPNQLSIVICQLSLAIGCKGRDDLWRILLVLFSMTNDYCLMINDKFLARGQGAPNILQTGEGVRHKFSACTSVGMACGLAENCSRPRPPIGLPLLTDIPTYRSPKHRPPMTTINPYRRNPTFLLLTMFLVLGSNLAAEAAEIVLRQQVTLQGPVVRLGDVADLAAGTDARLQELAATPLLSAPAPGTRKYLRAVQVRDLLAAQGISLAGLTFRGAPRVAIRMQRVRSPGTPSRLKKSSAHAGVSHWAGSRQTVARQTKRGMPDQTEPTEQTEPVVVTVRAVERGMLVRASDVEVRHWVGRVPFRAIQSPDRAVGLVARQSLRPGVPLQENHLQAVRLVERGETVTVFARTAGIQVRTHAIAKQNGSMGELIQVETADRRERFMARVTGLRELEVFATGASVTEQTALKPGNHRLR